MARAACPARDSCPKSPIRGENQSHSKILAHTLPSLSLWTRALERTCDNCRQRAAAVPLLKMTAPDAEHPKRDPVTGTPHMLRHSYATAVIQSGANAKTVQTLMGHHSVAFTMDQYADAWPEAVANAGEAASALLFAASGSKTVAAAR